MGVAYNPAIVTSGLVLCLDAGNPKGYDKYENLITDSEFSYSQLSGNTTATSGQNFVPYNRNTAVNFVNNGGSGNTYIYRTFNTSLVSGTRYVLSVFSNTSTLSYGQGGISSGQYSLVSSGVTSISDGWYRHWRVYSATVNNPSITPQVTISSGQNITLSGWQMELGEVMNDYYRTFGSTKTRGTTWTDLSGRGNNGTLTNGPTYSSSNGGSIVFDGVDDYIQLQTTTLSAAASTISSWINIDDFTTGKTSTGRVFIRRLGFNFNQLIAFYSGGYSFETNTNSNPYEMAGRTTGNVSSSAISAGSWFHFSLVFDSNTFYGYVNGVQTGSAAIADNLSFDAIGDGSNFSDTYPAYMKGKIANFKIYNRALTASEIQQNFNALRGRFSI